MEGIEMEVGGDPQFQYPEYGDENDFCAFVLSQYSKTSTSNEHHLHVCTAIGAMSQELKDQGLPQTPIAYFGATCSSLHRVSDPTSATAPDAHVKDALTTILSLLINNNNFVGDAVLKKKLDYLSDLLINKVLRLNPASPDGVVSGLKCVYRLLVLREKVNWSDVAQLYGVLVNYITDDRPKVRKQSHVCLRDVMSKFQNSPSLSPLLSSGSEAITNIFERFLLLAGGSDTTGSSEGPKGAQKVLYILDALKLCLPFMSSKSSGTILKYFKSLLELRQPLVTRRITDSLNALCIHPCGDVSAEALLELLCSLASSVSANESSADSMTFTARLLDVGMKRVYSLNRQICVVKLPVVFSSLSDVLASEHEEAVLAASEAFKSLIHVCIDESLIKQGVDRVMVKEDVRKTGPTIIEKLCATIESLLDYHFVSVWDMSFQVVSAMFDKLGQHSSYFLRGTIKSLADMQKLPDDDFPYRKQLHDCVGSALGAMGPETFLSLLPLNLEAEDLSEANLWLFPILKQYIVGAHLSYFSASILPMIRALKKKSAALEHEGKIYSSRTTDGLVYSLWSLLPSFCNYPVDTASSFKDLEKALCDALQEEPDVRGLVCSSLQILIRQNKKFLEGSHDFPSGEKSVSEEHAVAQYSSQIANANLGVLRSSARELLSVLSGVFLKSSKDDAGLLQKTIGELASISNKEVTSRFFKTTMHKLLKVTQEAGKAENSKNSDSMQVDDSSKGNSISLARAQLFDLAVSLLPGLDAKEIDLLFIAIEPALKDPEGLIQKKAYKVLSLILQQSDAFLSRKLEELLSLMLELLPSCHFSAKRHRLDCLYFIIVYVSKDAFEQKRRDVINSFLTEIILALKEANKKTRNRAYEIIGQIGHACEDEEKGGGKELLHHFFHLVAGGLVAVNPHAISAAVRGLARLAYEFTDLVSAAYEVLPSTLVLLQRKNREITKATLGLLKVLVAKSQSEGLQTHLRSMVEGLLNWQDSTKNHFKAKVKQLLEMLIRKCGMDAVKEVMPEEHLKLLTNIRKIKERKERKLGASSEETKSRFSKATTSRFSRWNHTKIFSDFGEEESENNDAECADMKTIFSRRSNAASTMNSKASTIRSKKTRKVAKSLQEDLLDQLDDEPLDLLDRQRTRSALRSTDSLKRKSEPDDEIEIDSDGRLVIREGERKPKRQPSVDVDFEGTSQAGSHLSINSKKAQKRRKTTESGWAYTGNEYASKKAAGDVKRKDKLEPYAYWPLDRKMVSRRPEHRAAARKGMASVVKLTKKLEGKSVSNALSVKAMKLKKSKAKATRKKAR